MSLFQEGSRANVLIVGASGGIGLEFVQQLLPDPQVAQIYATYRQAGSAATLMALAEEHPHLTCLPMDITEEAQIVAGLGQIQGQVGHLHLVVNCVGLLHQGTLQPEKSLRQINSDHLLHYFQVNAIGAVLLAKHLLPLLNHSDRSLFATISAKIGSIGDNQLGGWYGYRASKAALNMLIRTAAIEYGRKSPRTILVLLHPGTTDTQLSRPFQKNVSPEKLFSVQRTVNQLLGVLSTLERDDSGQFFSWDGSPLPW
jgi:NAD(P)-dependent dehydrogenase (short-subunit alcohol dehydrogenase family)